MIHINVIYLTILEAVVAQSAKYRVVGSDACLPQAPGVRSPATVAQSANLFIYQVNCMNISLDFPFIDFYSFSKVQLIVLTS